MPIREIVRLGHPGLRTPADAVAEEAVGAAGFQALIDDLVETLRASGGVGLAAPQAGEGLQLLVYEVTSEERDGEVIPLRVLINPMVEPHARELVDDWEGCLSIPGLRGLVPRYPEVKVQALDRDGQPVSYVAEGFEARIVQHEFDHLNGVVFLDRMRDLRSLAFEAEWQRYLAAEDEDPEAAAVE